MCHTTGVFLYCYQISLVSVEMHSITFVSRVFVVSFVLENLILYLLICYKGTVCVRIFFLKHKLIISVLSTTQRSYKKKTVEAATLFHWRQWQHLVNLTEIWNVFVIWSSWKYLQCLACVELFHLQKTKQELQLAAFPLQTNSRLSSARTQTLNIANHFSLAQDEEDWFKIIIIIIK